MDPKKYDFKVGEIASLPNKTRQVSKSGMKSYEFQINSRYICIRECVGNERGILVKVLGKTSRDNIIIAGGEPFFKEDKEEQTFSHIRELTQEERVTEIAHMLSGNEVSEAAILNAKQLLKQ